MPRPGIEITSRESTPPRSAPTDTGVWHVVGLTDRGVAEPTRITSLAEFVEHLGDRTTYSVLYDAAEAFFREGGNEFYFSRVVGPSAAAATVILDDASAADTLRVSANSAGAWGNALNVQIIAGATGGTFIVIVTHDTLGELERSPELADKTAALTWAEVSEYVALAEAGSSVLDPAVVASTSLAGGGDDRNNITDANWQTALDALTRDLGPGQVSAPGRTTTAGHQQLLAHAASHNRVALLDLPDSASKSTLSAAAVALRSSVNARYGAAFGPWAVIPGLALGTTRVVPYSAVQAGLIARFQAIGGSPNEPAAGVYGVAQYAVGLSQPGWPDADRQDLNESGVNLARVLYGSVRTYGYRSLVDPVTARPWLMFSNGRLAMAIAAEADVIAERYVFAMIDGRRQKIAEFGGVLTGMLAGYYQQGALFGDIPEDAFDVNVGADVNTVARLAAGELRAVLTLRMSPFAELVTLEIVKIATTEVI